MPKCMGCSPKVRKIIDSTNPLIFYLRCNLQLFSLFLAVALRIFGCT